ncbi:sensor histidine kinase [Microbispora sp. RL4-1S]|uniref:histidine kinase n=1 Tax=Microbispora oryzae TaxID=2806554 RepID=A0A940WNW4_9ACTN|nr:sensor histidine kinase [Microbispora oryzae]MBP2706518.1 sensor histidine kinase [Microbispora oryzae]
MIGIRRLVTDGGVVAVVVVAGLLMGATALLNVPTPMERLPKSANAEWMVLLKRFGTEENWRQQVLWWWLSLAPTAAAVFVRHRRPMTAFALAVLGSVAHVLSPALPHLPADLVVALALYGVAAAAADRRVSLALLSAAQIGLYGLALAAVNGLPDGKFGKYALVEPPDLFPVLEQDNLLLLAASQAVVPALLLAVAWTAGDGARTRRAHLATLRERAADLAREQEQRTALAVAAERGRIARELHDVVAHGLSVMVVQAQGGRAALNRHPERTGAALDTVITTGRASLAEMRRLLSLVRQDLGADDPARAPQPGLAALPELVDRVRAGGTPVTFTVVGEPLMLPAAVELSAYRIVQEALTNSIKHAGPSSRCAVDLEFAHGELRIRVRDSGGPGLDVTAPPSAPGNGLRGIAERVAALGGTLHAGPSGGGFELRTTLPLETTAEMTAEMTAEATAEATAETTAETTA